MAGKRRDDAWPQGAEGRLLRAHNHGVEMQFLEERFGRDGAEIRSKLRELAAGGASVRSFENVTPGARRASIKL